MIARLKGLLDGVSAETLVIDVGGVGYLVSVSARTLDRVGPIGGAVALHIETQVREDAIQLYGFVNPAERDGFRLLTTVQGVGGRVALAILSVLAPDDLARAVAGGDGASIARAQGVGPKLAARIINELKGKVGSIAGAGGALAANTGPNAPESGRNNAVSDAVSALLGLGFRGPDANRAVAEAAAELGADAEVGALVRAALKKSLR